MVKVILEKPWRYAGKCNYCGSIMTCDRGDTLYDREEDVEYVKCPVCGYSANVHPLNEKLKDELIREGAHPNDLR